MLAVRGVGKNRGTVGPARGAAQPRAPLGKAIFKDVAKDCVINDLSTSGARLRLTAFAALPDKFDLFIFETRRTYKAAVQWRAGDQAGVVFEQIGDVDDTLVAALVERMQHLETVVQGSRRDGGGFARRRGEGRGVIASRRPTRVPAVGRDARHDDLHRRVGVAHRAARPSKKPRSERPSRG